MVAAAAGCAARVVQWRAALARGRALAALGQAQTAIGGRCVLMHACLLACRVPKNVATKETWTIRLWDRGWGWSCQWIYNSLVVKT
jgi:hypothetical protein